MASQYSNYNMTEEGRESGMAGGGLSGMGNKSRIISRPESPSGQNKSGECLL